MRLDAQIAYGMAGLPQGTQQLGFGVKQGLSPLGVPGSHGQDSPLQREGPAVGSQSFAGDGGPVLPEPRQVAVAVPVLAEMVQAGPQWRCRWRWGWLQQLNAAEPAPLPVRCNGHRIRLKR